MGKQCAMVKTPGARASCTRSRGRVASASKGGLLRRAGGVVDAAGLDEAVVLEGAFDQFVAEEGEDAAAEEEGAGVAVPVRAGGAAVVVNGRLGVCVEFA